MWKGQVRFWYDDVFGTPFQRQEWRKEWVLACHFILPLSLLSVVIFMDWGLDLGPSAYQGNTLPLSYTPSTNLSFCSPSLSLSRQGFTTEIRLALNSPSSCLRLPSARIKNVSCHSLLSQMSLSACLLTNHYNF